MIMASTEPEAASCTLRPDPQRPDMARAVAAVPWGELGELPAGWKGRRRALVLWDGDCGICARCVAWAYRRDRHQRFLFAPYQSVPSPQMGDALRADCERAMQLIDRDGRRRRAGRAAILVLQGLGFWFLAPLRFPPLVWATELGYRWVAANRSFLSRFLRDR